MNGEEAYQWVRENLGPNWYLTQYVAELTAGPVEGAPTMRRYSVTLLRHPPAAVQSSGPTKFVYAVVGEVNVRADGGTLEEALYAAASIVRSRSSG